MTLILVALLGRFHHHVLANGLSTKHLSRPGQLASKCLRKMGPSWLQLWWSGSLQAEAGASGGRGMGRGRNFTFLPIDPCNTGVWGAPQNETSTTQAALYPESEPLELTPGRGTQICHILILSKLCKTPITEVPLGRASSARTAGRDSISTEG